MAKRRKRREWRPIVGVVRPKDRAFWVFRWRDRSGNRCLKTSDVPLTAPKAKAQRAALDWERKLLASTGSSRLTWSEACERYLARKMGGNRAGTIRNWHTTRNWIEKLIRPSFASDLDEAAIDDLVDKLQGDEHKLPASTIAGYLRYTRAFLRWCKKRKIIDAVPEFEMPAGAGRKRRSRDVSGEEFETLLRHARESRKRDGERWVRFLHGLRTSSLRIGELLTLHWESGPLRVDFTQKFPGFRILAEGQKNDEDQWIPMPPDFYAECIAPVPQNRRHGFVFAIRGRTGDQILPATAVRVISKIGERAKIATGVNADGSAKFATSHDIGRRSVATKYAGTLSQWQLASLMRHDTPSTTDTFYVGDQAIDVAKTIWAGINYQPPQPADCPPGG